MLMPQILGEGVKLAPKHHIGVHETRGQPYPLEISPNYLVETLTRDQYSGEESSALWLT